MVEVLEMSSLGGLVGVQTSVQTARFRGDCLRTVWCTLDSGVCMARVVGKHLIMGKVTKYPGGRSRRT